MTTSSIEPIIQKVVQYIQKNKECLNIHSYEILEIRSIQDGTFQCNVSLTTPSTPTLLSRISGIPPPLRSIYMTLTVKV